MRTCANRWPASQATMTADDSVVMGTKLDVAASEVTGRVVH